MSYRIDANQTFLKEMSTSMKENIFFEKKMNWNLSGVESEPCDNSTDTILNISSEGKERALNNQDKTIKKAGVTSAREQFEVIALNNRRDISGRKREGLLNVGTDTVEEWMRLDEPETYAEFYKLIRTSGEYREENLGKGFRLFHDWMRRKCFNDNGESINPVTGKTTLINQLEEKYSNGIHDVSFNICHESLSDEENSLWRFGTKFNVLLSADMLQEMEVIKNFDTLSKEQQEDLQSKFDKIDQAVNEMKQIEKDYEGDYVYLRFGVKFDEDYNVTYHANYSGCENKQGIMGYTPQELLEQLRGNNK